MKNWFINFSFAFADMRDKLLSAMNLSAYHLMLLTLLVLYLTFYAGIISFADGRPFVMDANESYSVLWHSRSIVDYSFLKTFWVTDEAFSFDAAAHPFVHTHQGNMPRLFGALIYLLGADTIESQVIVTTAIIGTVTLILCYDLAAKLVGVTFAFFFSIVLFGDYLNYAQWHVVTYRVWYGFLFFGVFWSLVSIWRHEHGRWPWVFLALNFFLLFYFELVFAGLVSVSFAIIAGFLFLPKRWPDFLRAGFLSVGFGCLALGVLLIQLVALLGWDTVVGDFTLTFSARNQGEASATITAMQEFYLNKNIAFWFNVFDAEPHRKLSSLIRSITHFELQVLTPILTLIVAVLVLGFLVGVLPVNKWLAERVPVRRTILSFPLITMGALAVGALLLVAVMQVSDLLFGVFAQNYRSRILANVLQGKSILAALFLVAGLLYSARMSVAHGLGVRRHETTMMYLMLIRASIYAFICVALIIAWPVFFDQSFRLIWGAVFHGGTHRFAVYVILVMSAGVGLFLSLYGSVRCLGAGFTRRILILLAAVSIFLVVYVAIYWASPGYVLTGYKWRHAPFSVFFTLAPVGIALAILFQITVIQFSRLYRLVVKNRQFGAGIVFSGVSSSVAAAVLVGFCGHWIIVQANYIKILPPNHYSFLQMLREPPYKGKTFAVNNYAAPVAEMAGNWAFYDPKFAGHGPTLTPDGHAAPDPTTYAWLADRHINESYRLPDYYICMSAQNLTTALGKLTNNNFEHKFYGCEYENAFQLLRQSDPSYGKLEAKAPKADDSWAIIKIGDIKPAPIVE